MQSGEVRLAKGKFFFSFDLSRVEQRRLRARQGELAYRGAIDGACAGE